MSPAATTSPVPSPSAAPAEPAAATPPSRPAYVPDNHWDAAAGKIKDEAKFAEWSNGNAARVAAEESRRLTLPQKPEDYKNEFSPAFKAPEGVGDPKAPLQGVIDPADPLLAQYRALAHKRGLDQETYSEGLDLIASLRVGEATQMKAAYDAEVGKLGAAGPARIDAIIQWMGAVAGPDAGALQNVLKMAPVASTVVALEKMMKAFSSQGVSSFSQSGRVAPPPDNKIPGYENLSFEQKRLEQDKRRAGAAR